MVWDWELGGRGLVLPLDLLSGHINLLCCEGGSLCCQGFIPIGW